MSFIYNRTAVLTRPRSELTAAGGQAGGLPAQTGGSGRYFGLSPSQSPGSAPGEDVIAYDLPCVIMAFAGRAMGVGDLPSAAPGPSRFRFVFKRSASPRALIRARDVLIDDEGLRYQVTAAQWTPLGYKVETIRLENV